MPKNKAINDPRGEEIRIKVGKYAGFTAWKDLLCQETPKQLYVVVELPSFGFVTGIRLAKSSVEKVKALLEKGEIDQNHAKQIWVTMEQRSKHHPHRNDYMKAAEKVWRNYLEQLKKE